METAATTLTSNAWSMSGLIISYTAGLLTLDNGMVSFNTAKGEQFQVPLSEIKNVKWPKLQMGYGVHMEVNGKKYKLTFFQPAGQSTYTAQFNGDYGRIGNISDIVNRISGMKDFKISAAEWRAVLGG